MRTGWRQKQPGENETHANGSAAGGLRGVGGEDDEGEGDAGNVQKKIMPWETMAADGYEYTEDGAQVVRKGRVDGTCASASIFVPYACFSFVCVTGRS